MDTASIHEPSFHVEYSREEGDLFLTPGCQSGSLVSVSGIRTLRMRRPSSGMSSAEMSLQSGATYGHNYLSESHIFSVEGASK